MSKQFSPQSGQTHVEETDGTISFPNSRHQFAYVPKVDQPGWYYSPELEELGATALAGPCALCGHLREDQNTVDGPNGEMICYACALSIGDALSMVMVGHGMFDQPRPKQPSRPSSGSVLRARVFARDNHTCRYCGARDEELVLEHVLPVVRGGKNTMENLVTACGPCNNRKGTLTPEEAGMPLRPLEGEQQ